MTSGDRILSSINELKELFKNLGDNRDVISTRLRGDILSPHNIDNSDLSIKEKLGVLEILKIMIGKVN